MSVWMISSGQNGSHQYVKPSEVKQTLINPHSERCIMSRSALISVVFIIVVLLAGCNFLGSGPSVNTPAVTPADVPTDSPTTTPREQIAPGVLPTGVYNASALLHAHSQILGTTSFTIRTNRTYRYPNGTLAMWTTRTRQIESGPPLRVQSRYRLRVQRLYPRHRNRSSVIAQDMWYRSDDGYWRSIYANNTTRYRVVPERIRSSDLLYYLTQAQRINETLSGADTQVTRITRNGSTYYRIEGPVSRDSLFFSSAGDQQNATQSLLIDPRGVIHRYELNIPIDGPRDTTMHRRYSITFLNIGNTTVEKPAWVETARNRTEPVNRTTTAE